MTYASRALDVLKGSPVPLTWQNVTAKVKGACGETISRALRRMAKRGLVTCTPVHTARPKGPKLWEATGALPPTTVSTSSKGSSRKIVIMCMPANKPTFVMATIQAITALMDAKQTFSAHDVTKKLRDMVKDATAHVDDTETGTVFAYGKKLPKITHEDVREIVHEFWTTGKMDGYDRVMNGDHWEYLFGSISSTAVPTPPVVAPVPMPAPDYNGDPTL